MQRRRTIMKTNGAIMKTESTRTVSDSEFTYLPHLIVRVLWSENFTFFFFIASCKLLRMSSNLFGRDSDDPSSNNI